MLHNLNNFPENIYELNGKRLMAFGAAFILLGGGIGWMIARKAIDRSLIAEQMAAQSQPLPAEASAVYEQWKYPNSTQHSHSTSGALVQSITTTGDSFDTVRQYYAKRMGMEESLLPYDQRPKRSPLEMPPNPSGFNGRSMGGSSSGAESVWTISGANSDHAVSIVMQPKNGQTQIIMNVARLRNK
jgi:hypothetical protein